MPIGYPDLFDESGVRTVPLIPCFDRWNSVEGFAYGRRGGVVEVEVVSSADACGYSQWRPSIRVCGVPDFNLGAVFREKLDERCSFLESRTMQSGISSLIHGIDVIAEFEG